MNLCLQNNRISDLLCVPRGVTAIVGGGGKTTLLLRLAAELQTCGTVIVGTTTHIFPPDGLPVLSDPTADVLKAALCAASAAAVGHPNPDGKLSACTLPPETLATLADFVLLEADGAKHLPLKAPAAHEPVIPPCASLVIAVAGMDGIGKPASETAFRPSLYAALTGKAETAPVTPEDAARVLASKLGQRKGVLPHMRFAVVLNKADGPDGLPAARAAAAALRDRLPVSAPIIIASLKEGLSCLF